MFCLKTIHSTNYENIYGTRYIHLIYQYFYSVMVQFHALGVLHQIRKSDKLAVTKMVSKLTSSGLRSPYAICVLVSLFRTV